MSMDETIMDEKIKVANLCEEVDEMKDSHNHLREKFSRLKMENEIDEKIEEVKDMNIVPTMPIGYGTNGNCANEGWMAMLAMMGLLGGGAWNGRRGEGCCETLALSNQITGEGRATVDSILSTSNMNQNAYNFGNLNTNMASGFGNLNTNLATQMGFLGDKADANALRFTEGLQNVGGQVNSIRGELCDISRQSAAETLALSEKLCAQGMMTQQEFFQVSNAVKDGDYALARQIADCCCTTQRSIDSVKFESERQYSALARELDNKFCQTNAHITAGNQRIIDQITSDRMKDLESRATRAEFQLSQNTQNDRIVAAIAGIATAAAAGASNPTAASVVAAAAGGGTAGATAGGLGGF